MSQQQQQQQQPSNTATTTSTISAIEASPKVTDVRAISKDFFSATIGSIFCCYTGQPFDTVKVRMQTDPIVYNNIISSTRLMLQNEGITSFWKGAVPTAMGMAAENVMAFGVNEGLKRAFPVEKHDNNNNDKNIKTSSVSNLLRPFIMGGITGVFSAIVVLPSEVIKCKLQIVQGVNDTSNHIIKEMIKKQGYTSFLCGLDGQLARDVSFYSIFFGGYELFCYSNKILFPTIPDELNYFISGGLAGMVGWTVAMPFDVPKTNVQASYNTKVIGSYIPEMIRIYKIHGINGFYSGLLPTLIRAFPANAALFTGVEMSRKFFDNYLWSA